VKGFHVTLYRHYDKLHKNFNFEFFHIKFGLIKNVKGKFQESTLYLPPPHPTPPARSPKTFREEKKFLIEYKWLNSTTPLIRSFLQVVKCNLPTSKYLLKIIFGQ
jgi:hypothetical protein